MALAHVCPSLSSAGMQRLHIQTPSVFDQAQLKVLLIGLLVLLLKGLPEAMLWVLLE